MSAGLLARRRDEEAKQVLLLLNDHDVEEEFEQIRASVKAEQAARGSWSQLLKGGPPLRRVLLGMILQVAQQLSGINVLVCDPYRLAVAIWLTWMTGIGLLSTRGTAPKRRSTSAYCSSSCNRQRRQLLAYHLRFHLICRPDWTQTIIDAWCRCHGCCFPRSFHRCWSWAGEP